MVISSSIGAAAHTDDPSGLGHLIVDLAKCRRHLVRQRAGYNEDIRLPG